jgi:hypothetical protein
VSCVSPSRPRGPRRILACPREGNEDLINYKDSACIDLHHSLIRKATYGALATPGKTETAQNSAFPPQCAARNDSASAKAGRRLLKERGTCGLLKGALFGILPRGNDVRSLKPEGIFPQDTVRGPRPRLREAPRNSAQGLCKAFVPPLNMLPELGRSCNSAKG